MIKDIRDGTLSSRCNLPPEMRATLARQLAKNPARARRLESFIKSDGTIRPKEYWPRLQLIGCWKGGTVGIRCKKFARWFARATPVRDLGLYGERSADDPADFRLRLGRHSRYR